MAKREWPRRLGFAVKVVGREGLKSNDARKWQSNPHLRVSIDYLHPILDYLDETDIRMYRISSDFVPYSTHPDMPQFHAQVRECSGELAELGRRARGFGIRLSLHPSQYVLLSAQDPAINAKGIADVDAQAELLDAMEQGPEAVVVLHLGGAYGDKDSAIARFVATSPASPNPHAAAWSSRTTRPSTRWPTACEHTRRRASRSFSTTSTTT
jgi:UV DNA damage endonuclease